MAAYTIVASGNNTRASAPCSSGEEGTQPGTFQIGKKGAAQNNMSSLHTITSLGCSIFHVALRRIDPVGFSGLHGSIRGVSGLRASPKVRLPWPQQGSASCLCPPFDAYHVVSPAAPPSTWHRIATRLAGRYAWAA